eukprot:1328103-Pyramimonas_sp.AAC.1
MHCCPKLRGGARPIGLLAASARLVERAHAALSYDWERPIRRDYDFAAPALGSEAATWHRTL